MSDSKTPLEIAREKDALRNRKAQEKAEARELEALNLVEKLSESEGQQGVDFEVIVTDVGVFGVKKPNYTVAKQFNAVPLDKRSEEDIAKFVRPHIIYPDVAVWTPLLETHFGVFIRCAAALLAMYEGRGVAKAGEF